MHSICSLVALLACACGGSESDPGSSATRSRLEALQIFPASGTTPPIEIRHEQRILPEEGTPWLVRGANALYKTVPGDSAQDPSRQRLILKASNDAVLRIPGSFDASTFNSVALQVSVQNPVVFSLGFILEKGELPLHVLVPSEGRSGTQVLRFSCPELALSKRAISKIQLKIKGRAGMVRIDWLDLLWQPPESFLPDVSAGPALVQARGEARRGVGLVQDVPLVARMAPQESGELRFAYHLPRFFQRPEQTAVLVVSLEAEGRDAVVQRLPLDKQAADRWVDYRYPLDEFAGAALLVRWSLEGADGIACAIGEPAVLHRADRPRHVLLITSDTHRADYLGAADSGIDVRTPVLDAFAKRGILFTDAFSSTNVTNPSHIALMTGTHPRDIGIYENNERLADAAPTLAEAFKSAGYATYAALSTRHLGNDTSGLGQGFDRLSIPLHRGMRDGTVAIDQTLRWLGGAPDVPTFVWLHLFDAHTPYDVPEELAGQYYPAGKDAFDPSLPVLEDVPPIIDETEFPGLRDLAYPEAMYRAEVSFLDAELDRLLGAPALRDAVIGFTADHGESLGEHGIFYNHDGLYTQSIHVPMILVSPGAPPATRSAVPVEHIDLGRTLLDLAGHPGVAFPGRNLVLLAEGTREPVEPRFALGAHRLSTSITREGWHLLLNLNVTRGRYRMLPTVKHSVELYHLSEDPTCALDQFDEQFSRAREMRAELIRWLAAAQDRGWRGARSLDATTIAALEALGYTAGAAEEEPDVELFDSECTCEWCSRFE